MNLVKLRFLRGGEPQGREYTYISKEKVEVGDTVIAGGPGNGGAERHHNNGRCAGNGGREFQR